MVFLMGDFNAKVGREIDEFPAGLGGHSLHTECNDNGVRLATVVVETRMVVGGTLVPHRDIHKQTWVSQDGRTRNRIDHIPVGTKFRNSIIDVKVMRGAECGSDHCMVVARARMKLKSMTTETQRRRRINLDNVKNGEMLQRFQEAMAAKMDEMNLQQS